MAEIRKRATLAIHQRSTMAATVKVNAVIPPRPIGTFRTSTLVARMMMIVGHLCKTQRVPEKMVGAAFVDPPTTPGICPSIAMTTKAPSVDPPVASGRIMAKTVMTKVVPFGPAL